MDRAISLISWIARLLAGMASGMIVNYLADVLPSSRRFTRPACQKCGKALPVRDYFLLIRCAHCKTRERARSIIVLTLGVLASILLHFFPFANLDFWAVLPLLIFLGVVVVIDMEHRLVLYETSLVGIVICLIYGLIIRGIVATLSGGLGGLAIMMVFYLTGLLFVKILSRIRKKEISEVAFGFGDVSAGMFLGFLTGWPGIVGAIIIAFFVFGIYSLALLLYLLITKKYRAFTSALPFAPFLILGVIVIYYL